MNKKLITILGFFVIPVGAILLNACGPQEEMLNSELALSEGASDGFLANPVYMFNGGITEYGRCNDAWDNDGDGLVDMHDPDCHLNAGPLRDLSLYDFPVGHNFAPDITKIPKTGPGVPGGFRDRAQMTRWFRFLTAPDGYTAGIQLMGPGVNNAVVPIPSLVAPKIRQGTAAQGNNNNVNLYQAHVDLLEHGFLTPPVAKPGRASDELRPNFATPYGAAPGLWPGGFYKGGSTGAVKPARTGNPDGEAPAEVDPN